MERNRKKGDNSLVERSGHSASSKALEGILINVGRIFPRLQSDWVALTSKEVTFGHGTRECWDM